MGTPFGKASRRTAMRNGIPISLRNQSSPPALKKESRGKAYWFGMEMSRIIVDFYLKCRIAGQDLKISLSRRKS